MDQFYKDLVEKIRDAAEKDIQIMAALRARTDGSRMSGGTPMKVAASCQNSAGYCLNMIERYRVMDTLTRNGSKTGGSFLRRQSVPLCGSKQRMCLESERRKLPALFRFPMMTGPRMWRTGRHNC